MKDVVAIVLAAGRGTRMKSDLPKVLHNILGKPMIMHVLGAIERAGIDETILIAGHGNVLLKKCVGDRKILIQKALLGSGDAVNTARKALSKYSGDIVVICGDTPLIKSETIKALVSAHAESGASATVMTVKLDDPTGYGRIVRGDGNRIRKIVEEDSSNPYEKAIEEINVGTYCFKAKDLFDALSKIKADNKKGEYYLTDAVEILNKASGVVNAFMIDDADEAIGVNTRVDLARAAGIMNRRVLEKLMLAGVTVEDPATTVIYPDAKIGKDSIVRPNTIIESDVEIGAGSSIGPFARIRSHVRLGKNVEVGNFVELVRTVIGDNTKVKHHTYLGDSVIGRDVNIGAGTITANFDGKNKNRTIIEDGASVGVGVRLIAPVKVGKRAILGAGCVITKNHNVPAGATVAGVPAKVIKR